MAATARSKLAMGALLTLILGFALAVCVGVGVWVILSAHNAAKIWPEGIPAFEASEPALPVDPSARAKLDALFEAIPDDVGSKVDNDVLEPVGPTDPDDMAPPGELLRALRAMDALVDCSGIAIEPWLLHEDAPPFIELLHLTRFRLARSWRYAEQDRSDEALAEMLRTLRLGVMLQHAGDSLLTAMVGLTISDLALQEIVELVAWERPPGPAMMAALAAELDAVAALPPGVPGAVLGECAGAEALYDEMRWWSRAELFAQADPVAGPASERERRDPGQGRECCAFVYDADRTIQLLRQRCLAIVATGELPGSQRSAPRPEALWEPSVWRPGQYLDNAVGRILLDISTPSYGSFFEREDSVRSRLAVVSTWVAVQRYLREEAGAEAPASLDSLVPGLLAEVPVDPWDGKPVRYDAEQRRVWATQGEGEAADEALSLGF